MPQPHKIEDVVFIQAVRDNPGLTSMECAEIVGCSVSHAISRMYRLREAKIVKSIVNLKLSKDNGCGHRTLYHELTKYGINQASK